MSAVLVVDDEPGIREVLSDILSDEGYEVFTAEDGYEGLSVLKTELIDLVLLDVWLPRLGGMDVLKEIHEKFTETAVIIISGHGTIDLAVKAVKMGAFDFIEKPLSLDRVTTLCRNALEMEKLKRENRDLRQSIGGEEEIHGTSRPLQEVKRLIEQSASSDARVLITGENGTGKELVARSIHNKSARRSGPFVPVNCAAIPDTLLESELFGHEKGAFTGAQSRRRGKFEAADGGTLFLDEIADMSLNAQAKVLRATQDLSFERVGGTRSVTVDVRIIAATNRDIEAEIAAGNFREDLFFRLNVVPIRVPPLRERLEDLPVLLEEFLERFDSRHAPEEQRSFSQEALDLLASYSWPGNVRELKNFVERITIMSDSPVLGPELVQQHLGERRGESSDDGLADFSDMSLSEAREAFERRLIERTLAEQGHNITQAARKLGMYPSNLHGKIKKLGIRVER